MNKNLQDYSGAGLSEEERREVRQMLDDHRRAKWLWGSIHRLVIAVGAVAAAITAIKVLIWEWLPFK